LLKPLHKIAPRSSVVNLPGRDLNRANLCVVCRVNRPDFAKILDFGLVLWSGRAEGLLRP